MTEHTSTTTATPATHAQIIADAAKRNAESDAAKLTAGVSKPATRAPAKRAAKTSAPAKRTPATRVSKPATPASERTTSQRKVSVMNAMIHACADLVRSDAAYAKAQRLSIDLRDVTRAECRAMLSARLSYAPGDEWDAALDAPTELQAGKRSKPARAARVAAELASAKRATHKRSASKPATPAKRKSATRAASKPAA